MKNLKNIFTKTLITFSVLLVLASCKKDKSNEPESSLGTITYQNKNMNITSGDYRSGNGDGAWLY